MKLVNAGPPALVIFVCCFSLIAAEFIVDTFCPDCSYQTESTAALGPLRDLTDWFPTLLMVVIATIILGVLLWLIFRSPERVKSQRDKHLKEWTS